MTKHIRWFFDVSRWSPTRDEWLQLTASIGHDELERVNKFVYKNDAKSSLVGQALIRKFVSLALNKPSNELKLTRTQLGRPQVADEYRKQYKSSWPQVFDFNVSHSGDYCVLAGLYGSQAQLSTSPTSVNIGVDVNQVVKKKTKQELDRFLDLMSRREFTSAEWDLVSRPSDDHQKCVNFTRLWCLKESFIKAIGLGLSFRLSRISFEPEPSNKYTLDMNRLKGSILNSTQVILDNQPTKEWQFLETALDSEHYVALAYNSPHLDKLQMDASSPFEELTIDNLVNNLKAIDFADEESWTNFTSKSVKQPS